MQTHSIPTLQIDAFLSKIAAMPYTKKKPYRHKGGSPASKKKYGSDLSMVKAKEESKASSTSYKDHIDGA